MNIHVRAWAVWKFKILEWFSLGFGCQPPTEWHLTSSGLLDRILFGHHEWFSISYSVLLDLLVHDLYKGFYFPSWIICLLVCKTFRLNSCRALLHACWKSAHTSLSIPRPSACKIQLSDSLSFPLQCFERLKSTDRAYAEIPSTLKAFWYLAFHRFLSDVHFFEPLLLTF